ncbi:MAG TPA: transaldolase family protein, partial [Candidatus Saccharimonadales bacterium]
ELLGFLDGQTTNPTLVAKHPLAKQRFENGDKFSADEIYDFYRQVVGEISQLIPEGSVSIEVYADRTTDADTMFEQGKKMYTWIPNAHIKYPVTNPGLAAAERSVQAGMRVNMTLCFSQAQGAAVYAATKGAKAGDVFVSPFAGRLDDIGENGLDLIGNIVRMYKTGDGHVQVLAASVRNLDHFMQSLALEADIITAPFSVLEEWSKAGKPVPGKDFKYSRAGLKNIPYQAIDLEQDWSSYDIHHELTDKGIARFSEDWNSLTA